MIAINHVLASLGKEGKQVRVLKRSTCFSSKAALDSFQTQRADAGLPTLNLAGVKERDVVRVWDETHVTYIPPHMYRGAPRVSYVTYDTRHYSVGGEDAGVCDFFLVDPTSPPHAIEAGDWGWAGMGKSPAAPARTGADKLPCGTSILCNCSACVPAAATPTMMVGGGPRERKPSAKAREDERAAHGRDEDGGAATDGGTPAAKRARAAGSAAAKLPAHRYQERRDAAGKQAKAAARKAR